MAIAYYVGIIIGIFFGTLMGQGNWEYALIITLISLLGILFELIYDVVERELK